jgi:hypothetical protein
MLESKFCYHVKQWAKLRYSSAYFNWVPRVVP